MALAVTHVLITIVLLDLMRHYIFKKKTFPRYLIVVGGIAGLAPDFDIVITWFYNFFTNTTDSLHGLFSHSLTFVLLFAILGLLLKYGHLDALFKKHKKQTKKQTDKWSKIMFVIAFGWFMHIFLDCMFGGYKTFLWPLEIATTFCPQFGISHHAASVDAILLVLWIVHEEMHGYVKDWF